MQLLDKKMKEEGKVQLLLTLMIVGAVVIQPAKGQTSDDFQSSLTYSECLAGVHELGNDLSASKISAVYSLLQTRSDSVSGMSLLKINAIKNSALLKLIAQDDIPDDLGERMVAMYRDRNHDDLWRDYCVQHFEIYHGARWPYGNPSAGDVTADAIRAAYWEAVGETDGTIAGTALLGIERVSRRDATYDRKNVATAAAKLARSRSVSVETRIAAFQVCAQMGEASVLTAARQVAVDGDRIPLRMAAIAALGAMGIQADVGILESIVKSGGHRYVRNAAKSALRQLRKRVVLSRI